MTRQIHGVNKEEAILKERKRRVKVSLQFSNKTFQFYLPYLPKYSPPKIVQKLPLLLKTATYLI